MVRSILLLLAIPLTADAGLLRRWGLQETANAPVLIAGRVLSVQRNQRDADASRRWSSEVWATTAEIDVLRSYTHAGETIAANRIRVHFLGYGPSGPLSSPPAADLPRLESGQVLIFPLLENANPASEPWRLIGDSGEYLTIPTAATLPESQGPPATARLFLLREIANSLSRGVPLDVAAAGRYIASQDLAGGQDLTGELMPLLEPEIGEDRQGWAEVATNILAGEGIPRPIIAELLSKAQPVSGQAQPDDLRYRKSLLLAQAALRKLGASSDTDTLLIKTLIAEAPLHAWGSGATLAEYANNPVATETLGQALRADVPGSSWIASGFVRGGNRDVLPDALVRALKVADRPGADGTDLQGAAGLLRDYGSDRDLEKLAALVQKYQTRDKRFYSVLWQYATEAGNPREARVLAVVLRDRRVAYKSPDGPVRYCDFAVGVLERAVGQHFGTGAVTQSGRDQAVEMALSWLGSQGMLRSQGISK